MDENRKAVENARIDRTMNALAKNGMKAYFAPTKEDAVKVVESLLKYGDVISCGGSQTLRESGVRDLMLSGYYDFLDRDGGKHTPEEVYRDTFTCDAFLTSSNAVTEKGELYNVDGNGNRTSVIIYGPKKVIVVAGYNKIVRDIPEAVYRVRTVAAPANGMRLNRTTPCAKTGKCICTKSSKMTDGCDSADRMCCHYVITGKQRVDRIHVVLVGEELGY